MKPARRPSGQNEQRAPGEVALFVTCLVDLFRPEVGFAAATLLERAGWRVVVPPGQTCCGQPAFNAGDQATARRLARRTVAELEGFERVVVPSGSCAAMIRVHYPELLADDPVWRRRAESVAARTRELATFLGETRGSRPPPDGPHDGESTVATFHDSCHGLRELGIRDQPRRLLGSVPGLELVEMERSEACCGFGGTFCVKMPEISVRMAEEKAEAAEATGAALLLGGDLACLMNVAGVLTRRDSALAVRHFAEVLAGEPKVAPIGRADEAAPGESS